MQQQRFIDKSNLACHVSGYNSAHLPELKTVQYSLWYVVPNMLPVGVLVTEEPDHQIRYQITDRQRIGYNIDISCIAQSKAPEDGQDFCSKHVELNWIYQ